jgi:hypothetical protein
MALDSEEESEQNEAMKIRAALENPQTFGVPLLSALEKRHARFRLKEAPGVSVGSELRGLRLDNFD